MENQKSKKGLIAFLITIIIILGTSLGLLLSGVIKNPFIKENKCNVKDSKTTTVDNKNTSTNNNETTEVKKETRYYQYVVTTDGGEPKQDIINYSVEEIVLFPDGTVIDKSGGASSGYSWEGRYVEDESSIALLLNTTTIDLCKDRTVSQSEIMGSCSDARFLIKENGNLIEANDDVKLYKFSKDGALETTTFKQVQKSDLLTDIKNSN